MAKKRKAARYPGENPKLAGVRRTKAVGGGPVATPISAKRRGKRK